MAQLDLQLIHPREFFKEQLTSAKNDLKLTLDDQVEFYLVNLLCQYVACQDFSKSLDQPLAFRLQEALEAEPQLQIKLLRDLGDLSLYMSGYFQDYYNRKTFDVTYVMDMGSVAYQTLSNRLAEKSNDSVIAYFNHYLKTLLP